MSFIIPCNKERASENNLHSVVFDFQPLVLCYAALNI